MPHLSFSILLLLPILVHAQSFEAYQQEQDRNFNKEKVKFIDFKAQEDAAFTAYQKEEKKAISKYKKKLKNFWPQSDLEEAKKLTLYSKDLTTKSLIDFEKNEVVISKISKQKVSKEALLHQLKTTLSLNNQEAYQKNILEQNIKKQTPHSPYIKVSNLDSQPLLYLDTPKPKELSVKHDGDRYELRYKLPKNASYKRSYNYLLAAKSNARRFKLQANVLLAIMHTESSFNPLARSHIPAFGLMQIVPRSAGIDAYQFLYKKRRLLSASYLYNTQNNIEMGSAYFHILYYKYLRAIKNPQSRLYCAIAGYNTGAGNVAWAFVRSYDVRKATKIINTMSPTEVYKHLQKYLRYDEPKAYLERVSERSINYKKLYRL